MSAVDQIKQRWRRVPAKQRRYLVVGGAVTIVVALLWVFASGSGDSGPRQTGDDVIKNVLTNSDTREIGIDALSSRLDTVIAENRSLNKEIQRLKKDDERNAEGQDVASRQQIEQLQARIDKESQARQDLEKKIRQSGGDKDASGNAAQSASDFTQSAPRYDATSAQNAPLTTSQIFNTRDTSGADSSQLGQNRPPAAGAAGGTTAGSPPKIVAITAKDSDDGQSKKGSDGQTGGYLPAGSMITGVNITGMDAPTGTQAKQNPFPITLRVKHEAILPNRFTQDIKECFLIASGYGDLSSERAYLRAETISCVREDGGVIEKSLKAFASGEDGKAGVRGRLVSKQGSVIANSLTAGFLAGASKAFDVNPVPTLNVTPNGEQQYQSVLSGNSLQGAAVSGVSSALDRIAQFYIDMAEDMYPVIEVNAGRRITFIVQKGVDLTDGN